MFRLEREKWLTLQNEGLQRELRLLETINETMKEEAQQRREMQKEMESALSIATERLENGTELSQSLQADMADCQQIGLASADIEKAQEKEITSLRRRLTSQEIIAWAVASVGGALLLLAHL